MRPLQATHAALQLAGSSHLEICGVGRRPPAVSWRQVTPRGHSLAPPKSDLVTDLWLWQRRRQVQRGTKQPCVAELECKHKSAAPDLARRGLTTLSPRTAVGSSHRPGCDPAPASAGAVRAPLLSPLLPHTLQHPKAWPEASENSIRWSAPSLALP